MSMVKIDFAFIEACRDGDARAISAVKKICYSMFYGYSHDNHLAGELAGTAISKIVIALRKYDPSKGKGNVEANFVKWVRSISQNIYIDYRDHKKKEIAFSELALGMGMNEPDHQLLDDKSGSIEKLMSSEAYNKHCAENNPMLKIGIREVEAVFGEITDGRKQIALRLKFLYGLTTKEIADAMGQNFDAVQSLLFRGTKELRGLLLKRGIDSTYLTPETWNL